MDAPFIFIGTHTIKAGKAEEFKRQCREFTTFIEANEPRLIYFGFYFDEAGSEVTVVQIHPDAASMAFHMQVGREHFVQAYELLDTTKSIQIYGTPGAALLEQMRQVAPPGVPIVVRSEFAGFNRLTPSTV